MRMKRVISIALSAVLLGSTATVAASAQETEVKTKTYHYVALGDSVTAGYGLSGPTTFETMLSDPALLLTDELLSDPIEDAYPAVFGGYLAEMGEEKGVATTATNLGSCAYRAEDVAKTITTEGYKGEVAGALLSGLSGSGEILSNYHIIYQEYLTQADLVSIMLGGNDMIMGFAVPMTDSDNPVLNTIGSVFALVMIGCDVETAAAAGLMILDYYKDDITAEDVKEAATYFYDFFSDPDAVSENAANEVKSVIDAVREINPDADVALLDIFNPFGNSLEYDGQVRDLGCVIKSVFNRALDEVFELPIVVTVNNTKIPLKWINETTVEINGSVVTSEYLANLCKEAREKLKRIISEEISYPLQYLTAGKFVDPLIRSLDAKIKATAEETGCIYVDVYHNVSNENDFDPHPNAQTHREIADLLKAALSDTVSEKMAKKAEHDVLIGDVNLDGKVTIDDATMIQKAMAELIKLDDTQKKAADTNGDGQVDINDVTHLQKYLAEYDGIVLGKTIE